MNKEQFKKWIMSMLYYRYKIKATENGEFLGMIDDNLNQLINSVKEECAKIFENQISDENTDEVNNNLKINAKAIRDKE